MNKSKLMQQLETLTSEQIEITAAYFHKHCKIITFAECIEICFGKDSDQGTVNNRELSAHRVKILMEGGMHVKKVK
ncbi:MAG: hypothetical protein IKO75_14600 [Bacteroidales bacterium]|nr:hypothetical protein [Bacteroidales bacterium]